MPGESMRVSKSGYAFCDSLQFCLIDLVGQELRLIGNEIVKAGADTWNRIAVVIHHPEAKADGQEQAGEIVEVEGSVCR